MNINRKNYEIWFLDYYEDRLTPEQVKELMVFLELNYDLKEEFENFENITLPPVKPVIFDAKESLKKNLIIALGEINKQNYKDFFIAELENDLQPSQLTELKKFISINPHLKKENELFSLLKVTPDKSIVFDRKEQLKKIVPHPKEFNLNKLYYPISIAASLIILFGIYLAFNNNKLQTLTVAYRNNINIDKRAIQNNNTIRKIIINNSDNTSTNNKYYAHNTQKTNNNIQKVKNIEDFKYVSIINPKLIAEKSDKKPDKLTEINVSEDLFVLAQKQKTETENEKQLNDKNLKTLSFGGALWAVTKETGKKHIIPKVKETTVGSKVEEVAETSMFKGIVAGLVSVYEIASAN